MIKVEHYSNVIFGILFAIGIFNYAQKNILIVDISQSNLDIELNKNCKTCCVNMKK